MMDAHYWALMDLSVSLNNTAKLRETYDMIEKHLRSLKAFVKKKTWRRSGQWKASERL